ncbi:MAG: response regulator [Planctomycetota bacterium]
MLVLSRRANETIQFPALGVTVEVLRCGPRATRIGIEAPREVEILRGEIADKLARVNAPSGDASIPDVGSVVSDIRRSTDHDRHLRALLVDDNDNESRLLASYLRVKGFDVITASDGQEAIGQLSANEPDIVLLDMSMPQFDGRWTIGQIRSHRDLGDMPVFAVSGTSEAEADVEVGPNGVNAWFHKPLNPEVLATEIHRCCDPTVVASSHA